MEVQIVQLADETMHLIETMITQINIMLAMILFLAVIITWGVWSRGRN